MRTTKNRATIEVTWLQLETINHTSTTLMTRFI